MPPNQALECLDTSVGAGQLQTLKAREPKAATRSHQELLAFLVDLYACYRTSRMNQLYYGARLATTKRRNTWLEIGLAVGTSSAVATWAIWKTSEGEVTWAILTALSTIIAMVKPTLQLPKDIERYTRLFVGHGDVYFDLKRVVAGIGRAKHVTPELENRFHAALERLRQLGAEDDPHPAPKLLRRSFDRVNREVPPQSLWMP